MKGVTAADASSAKGLRRGPAFLATVLLGLCASGGCQISTYGPAYLPPGIDTLTPVVSPNPRMHLYYEHDGQEQWELLFAAPCPPHLDPPPVATCVAASVQADGVPLTGVKMSCANGDTHLDLRLSNEPEVLDTTLVTECAGLRTQTQAHFERKRVRTGAWSPMSG